MKALGPANGINKCVERILPVHEAQILTYLRLARVSQGLLINFNSPRLKEGALHVKRKRGVTPKGDAPHVYVNERF
ncbi:MAG TPA: GxxExxY protein [Vicinamibacterales bacterium]|nr:GxxExxY protein [Vicinamibacterales bacterium]